MLALETVFSDLFDDKQINFTRLRIGTDRHIDLIIVNNGGGMFTAMLTETQTARNNFFGDTTGIDQALIIQKSKTTAKTTIETTFLKETRKLESLILASYEKTDDIYKEAFPSGLTEYNNATDGNRLEFMIRLKTYTNNHIAEFGQPKATLFNDIKLNYEAATSNQGQQIGAVATERTERHVSRKALTLQLTKNVHTIGAAFPGNVDRCMDFWDENKFLPRNHAKTILIPETLTQGQKKEIIAPENFVPKLSDELNIAITSLDPTGKKVILFFGNDPADESLIGLGITADGAEPASAKLSEMGYAANKKLYAKYIEGTGDVEIEVEIVIG